MAALLPAAQAADSDLTLSYQPLFAGTARPELFAPYLIQCENKGENTKGIFTFSDDSFRVHYPIDLPRGSKKQFIAYLPKAGYDSVNGRLVTDIGSARIKFPEQSGSSNCLLSISDTEGLLNFTRSLDQNDGRMGYSFTPLTASPDLLPDRATSYLSFSGIFLNEGAERIEGEKLKAIERYVLLGGTLVISGGASAPIFSDARWQHLLPVRNVKPENITPRLGDQVQGLQLSGTFTMSVGQLNPGAIVKAQYQNRPFIVSRPYGFGRVVFLAVNAFEDPVSKWEGKSQFIGGLQLVDSSRRIASVHAAARMNQDDPYAGYMGSYPGSPSYNQDRTDPFSATVPPTSTVVWILLGYFVLVVPLNLLILRKMGKGEWAWITSPILSFAFAAIFFRFAADLYTAQLSTATTGILVADVGSKQTYYLGGSQVFFPRGGRYDLGLQNVEGILSRESDPYSDDRRGISDFNPTDTGEINVRNLSVPNLSFREFSYYEARQDEIVAIVPVGKDTVRIINQSGRNIKRGSLFYEGGIATVKDLKPGESDQVKLESTGRRYYEDGWDVTMATLTDVLTNQSRQNRVALLADIEDFEAGPRIGKLVSSLSKTKLVAFGTRSTR